MISFRGDAHKFYLRLQKKANKGIDPTQVKEIQELTDIQSFYETINTSTLRNIHYRVLKEKNGSGLIPILVTAVPWILFIFGTQVQAFFENDDSYLWLLFVFLYLIAVTISVSIHFRERSWATVHSKIIEDIVQKREGLVTNQ
ncbi:hypothetical protein [Halalkalibacter akibai]|uniref:Uncharacterized protein n=1 Tax=Halalkalibacter akibai (strain ATCC 43226 / DSM 21942 / CIP 109018 / JCM 9157 / 1139) TaxID=1236973 RepID=W4QRK0_HALA3|nr:hypothetical protein [Halalkalibacter akibai]GAE34735.1 hypothetical protein JCM9157_1812 [Halalkalibacter akibai JCM 9157]